MGSRKRRTWLGLLAVAGVTALLSAGLAPHETAHVEAGGAPWQVPPTPPFPTLAPTEPFPTLPPNVPTPSLFTPTPTRTQPSTSSPPPPTPSPNPSATPSPTISLELRVPAYLPYAARDHLYLEPTRQ